MADAYLQLPCPGQARKALIKKIALICQQSPPQGRLEPALKALVPGWVINVPAISHTACTPAL
ncbi:hypothetical protein GCM10011533_26620 [Streptosporangium jomthongense]|nr:hypothetical protein GCM10011533_26620 [Streptosporangium jomthongense]